MSATSPGNSTAWPRCSRPVTAKTARDRRNARPANLRLSAASRLPDELAAPLKRLHLANAGRAYPVLIERVEREDWSFREFLLALAREEVAQLPETRLQRCVHKARFPVLKPTEEFDYSVQPALRHALLGTGFSLDFAQRGGNLSPAVRSGRGKTLLATAIACKAILPGNEALFSTATALIDDLALATRHRRIRDCLKLYVHPHVMASDELSCLSSCDSAANRLFHVVDKRRLKRRSTVFTTNRALADWGVALHDRDLAAAIINRVLGRGRYVPHEGPSMRTRHLEELDYQS